MVSLPMIRRYTLPHGQTVFHGEQFTANDGVQYPANWCELASDDDLIAHGIVVDHVPDMVASGIENAAGAPVNLDAVHQRMAAFEREQAELALLLQTHEHQFQRADGTPIHFEDIVLRSEVKIVEDKKD